MGRVKKTNSNELYKYFSIAASGSQTWDFQLADTDENVMAEVHVTGRTACPTT